ncbi:insulin-like growth factor 1 receptor isoform X1 [Frankliniella occidentalis]|uniref:receptor protein-tyrosine kinase n=1 Tax=Frankliniella occidentalis TaxID=133901 RepID=A0A9C6U5P1_FRAOC|nr:insulin-like growth factor 1 receptor isoform X1 [Frankliniella occidentalis]
MGARRFIAQAPPHGAAQPDFTAEFLSVRCLLLLAALGACAPALAEPKVGGSAFNSTGTVPAPASPQRNRSICPDMDIRNRPSQLRRLEGCVVVEGNLSMVLMDNMQPADFAPYSFPDLREVTGYVLFFKVSGLQSLGQLFPNLTLIRGTQLVVNQYSLVAFQMPDLVELGLSSLELVQRGAVRIDGNPLLCYADTLDWDVIAPGGGGEHYVYNNRPPSECQPACKCPSGRCWGYTSCRHPRKGTPRTPSGAECNKNCAIGCNGTSAHDCIACAGPQEGSECVERCSPGKLVFQRRRCVPVDWCEEHHSGGADGIEHQGECVMECPEGTIIEVREEKSKSKKKLKEAADKEDKEKGKKKKFCKPCVGPCRTECPGAAIRTPRDALQLLKGCTVINGTLEIEIPHGGEEVEKALEPALGNIQVITGSLVVSRSRPLSSLRFLRSLREVRGLDRNKKLAVFINDNDNLQSLFDWDENSRSKTLTLAPHAQITFYYNPRLCPQEIKKFEKVTNLTKGQMLNNFNGFNNPCGAWNLSASVSVLGPESAVLTWRTWVPAKEVLAYAVYVTKAVRKNVTEYAGSIFCRYQPSDGDLDDGSVFGWMVVDVRFGQDDTEVSTLVPRLQPATMYAYYIKTYTTRANVNSPIRYFQTPPDRPSPPSAVRAVAVRPSAGSLLVAWSPPPRTNGVLSHYIITGELRDDDDQRQLGDRDFCEHPATPPYSEALAAEDAQRWAKGDESSAPTVGTSSGCCCSGCCRIPLNEEQCERLLRGSQDVLDACGNRVQSLDRCTHVLYNVVSDNMNQAASSFFPRANQFPGSSGGQGRIDLNLSEEWDKDWRKRRFVRIESASATSSLVETLVPFGLYSISVHACGKSGPGFSDPKGAPLSASCSAASMTTARSLHAEGVDLVSSANATLQGDKLLVSWAEPQRPNGMLVSYHVRYRDRHKFEGGEQCVTRQSHRQHGGRVPIPLRSSVTLDEQSAAVEERYVVELRAVSLAGPGRWVGVEVYATKRVPAATADSGEGHDATASPRSTAKTVVAVLLLLLGLLAVALFYLRRRAARDSLGDESDLGQRRLVSSDLTECWDLPDLTDEPDHWPPNVHFDPDANRVSFEPLPTANLQVMQNLQSSAGSRAWLRWPSEEDVDDNVESTLPSAPPLQQLQHHTRWHPTNPFHPNHSGFHTDDISNSSPEAVQYSNSKTNPFTSSDEGMPTVPLQEDPKMSPTFDLLWENKGEISCNVDPLLNKTYTQEYVKNSRKNEEMLRDITPSLMLNRKNVPGDYEDWEEIKVKSPVNEDMHKSPSTDSFTSVNLSESELLKQDLSNLRRCDSREGLD